MKNSAKIATALFAIVAAAAAIFVVIRYMDELKKHFARLQTLVLQKVKPSCECDEIDEIDDIDDIGEVAEEGTPVPNAEEIF